MIELDTIIQDMRARLSEKRFAHTESVTQTALRIREALGLDPALDSKLQFAGWLHDSCKELTNVEMLLLAKFYKIELYEADKLQPNLLHARVAARWIEDEYEIFDPDISIAIRDHTLGGIEMPVSAKILFLADMIEPLRDAKEKSKQPSSYNELDEIRGLIYTSKNLDQALLKAMDSKITYTIKKSQCIHELGIQARNVLLASIKS